MTSRNGSGGALAGPTAPMTDPANQPHDHAHRSPSTETGAALDALRLARMLAGSAPDVVAVALVQLAEGAAVDDAHRLAVLLAAEQIIARTPSLADDWPGGRYHRPGPLLAYGDLARRRYPPTGDRDLWIRYGPAGPPAPVTVRRPEPCTSQLGAA